MPPRTLASLAHALCVAPDLDAALVALGESLADIDRAAHLALLRYDGRREMLRERLTPSGGRVTRSQVETTFDHLPAAIRRSVSGGAQFAELGDRSEEFARLFGLRPMTDGGLLALRGIAFEGALAAVIALYEPKKFFGTRTSERFAPSLALFDLSVARFFERDARQEAVRTLEDVTQRVHGEYVKKLSEMEGELSRVRGEAERASSGPTRVVAAERAVAEATEEARRATRRADGLEQQLMAAVGQLEQAHVELHRRSDVLRQKIRTIYLIDRMLGLYESTSDAKLLAEGLLSLAGEDMQAQRCSLMLVAPDGDTLYLAAARGLSPEILEGVRTAIGDGVAGRVAQSRQPILVQDVSEARHHPLLQDQYFTTGSFISFPLVLHGTLFGVVNLTNRARLGVYGDEDVERVRLLALLLSLMVAHSHLAERLFETIGVR
jgi:putative methionine-R-sulfoxide reductase with GAF domain